jgi:hypothetical protein
VSLAPELRRLIDEACSFGALQCAAGFAPEVLRAAEARWGFRFPPDLEALLRYAAPVGDRFPDWGRPEAASLRSQFDQIWRGIEFDLQQGAFWLPRLGARPANAADRIELMHREFLAAPRLIPLYGHRYLPALPHDAGNPVFSVMQTDVIHYGADLADWLRIEFLKGALDRCGYGLRRIDFWTEAVEASGRPLD